MPALKVLILTQQDCGFCETAKTLLERLAREYPLAISTLAIDSSEGQAMAQKGGILFPPGIFIDGAALSYGRPSEGRIRREIEDRLAKLAKSGAFQLPGAIKRKSTEGAKS